MKNEIKSCIQLSAVNSSNNNDCEVSFENADVCVFAGEPTMNLIGLKKPELRKIAK